MLDRLPLIWQHLIIQLLAGLLGWAAADLVPWLGQQRGLVAVAGALLGQILLVITPLVRGYGVGVGQDGKHEDTGSVRVTLLMAVLLVAAVVGLVLAVVRAPKASAAPRPVEHVAVWSVRTCDGTLDVGFGLELLRHRGAWVTELDDGAARVELHHVGAAAGPGGHWEAYPARTSSGGEGHLRVDVTGLPYWDAVRVLHGGYVSTQRLPEARCTA